MNGRGPGGGGGQMQIDVTGRRGALLTALALLVSSLGVVTAWAQDENRPPSGSMQVRLQPPDTIFTVDAEDPDGDELDYAWTADIECGTFRPNFPEENQATWQHPAGEPPNGCPHEEGTDHRGVVSVVVTDSESAIQCVHEGSGDGEHDCNVYGEDIGDCTINLRVYDGMGGGSPADISETSRGAFTVVNTNDTDGVGGSDTTQARVEGEVDLMRIVLNKPEPSAGGIVTLDWPTNKARIYRRPTKARELVGTPSLDFPIASLPKTLWVEATDASASLRDVTFTYTYRPTATNEACSDEAKATFIQARLVSSLHDASDAVWLDLSDPPLASLERTCAGFGLRPRAAAPRGVRNCIGFRFEITPPGVWSEPGIMFDVTRQKASRYELDFPGNTPDLSEHVKFPEKDEPNDDAGAHDESASPDANGIMFSYDGPGTPELEPSDRRVTPRTRFSYRGNFREFIRVRFDGTDPAGNRISGTRCSAYVRWRAAHSLVLNRKRIWRRTTGDDAESLDNLVEPR